MSDWRHWPVLPVGFQPWFLLVLVFTTLAIGF